MGLLDFLKRNQRPEGLSAERAADYEAAERLLREYLKNSSVNAFYQPTKPDSVKAGQTILESALGVQAAVVHQALATAKRADWNKAYRLRPLFSALLRRHLPFEQVELCDMLRLLSSAGLNFVVMPAYAIVKQAERFIGENGLSDELGAGLKRLRESITDTNADATRISTTIDKMLGASDVFLIVDTGEAWASAALSDLAGMGEGDQGKWEALLAHALASEAPKPSNKWLGEAKSLVEAIGREAFRERVLGWFSRLDKSLPNAMTIPQQDYKDYEEAQRVGRLVGHNGNVLKGLVWCVRLFENDDEMARALGTLGETAFKKIPGVGARAAKVGNACVSTLGTLPGMEPVAQLSRLKLKVKYQNALSNCPKIGYN